MIHRLNKRIRSAGEAGFTLIELLIVIVILGILAGIVVFSVSGITDRGKTSACKADLKTVQVASEAFYAQSTDQKYAGSLAALSPKFLQEVPTTVSYSGGGSSAAPTIGYAGGCP